MYEYVGQYVCTCIRVGVCVYRHVGGCMYLRMYMPYACTFVWEADEYAQKSKTDTYMHSTTKTHRYT